MFRSTHALSTTVYAVPLQHPTMYKSFMYSNAIYVPQFEAYNMICFLHTTACFTPTIYVRM